MVDNNNENMTGSEDSEITYDTPDTTETELVDDEATAEQKQKALRQKLQQADVKNRELHEELQRTKADFLNARKRLDDDRLLDKKRMVINHVEKLLPLADSFYLAMTDKVAWEKADEKWRKGIEAIVRQLENIFTGYGVTAFDPTGSTFDPIRHDALSTTPVESEADHNRVLQVMQLGYELTEGDQTTVIRPARVTVGEFTSV